ncbi:MAG: recombinase family protein [bacterium]
MLQTAVKQRVCAIYTRKSNEKNLNVEFNSLDAQRESAESYIKSQKAVGWEIYPERYDDPAYSGGDMERPAIRRLLNDARLKKFDVVVVYKVDRLSRSLRDFVKIMEVFEKYGVSFVAVTQHFDTSSSMGRLTLNILLSFAQFEREIDSERIRDKRAAQARRGKWLGGYPIIGYDLDYTNKKTVTNDSEKALVKQMFDTYAKVRSLSKAAKILNNMGYRTKEWKNKKDNIVGGFNFNKANLVRYLKNPRYIGKIPFNGELFQGEHEALVDERLFSKVQKILKENDALNSSGNEDSHGFLLKGLVKCSNCGSAMTPNFAYSKSKKYFYYKCIKVIKLDKSACNTSSVPARELENIVIDRIKHIAQNEKIIQGMIEKAKVLADNDIPKLKEEHARLLGESRKIDEQAHNLINVISIQGMQEKNKYLLQKLDDLAGRSEQIRERIRILEFDVDKVRNQEIDKQAVLELFKYFKETFDSQPIEERKELIRLMVKDVVYDAKNHEIALSFYSMPIDTLSPDGFDERIGRRAVWLMYEP